MSLRRQSCEPALMRCNCLLNDVFCVSRQADTCRASAAASAAPPAQHAQTAPHGQALAAPVAAAVALAAATGAALLAACETNLGHAADPGAPELGALPL